MNSNQEPGLIGALLNQGSEKVPQKIQRLLKYAPQSFDDQRCGILAVAIRSAISKGIPLHPSTVSAELNGMLDQIGGVLFVEQMASESLPMSVAEHESDSVWSKFNARRAADTLEEASKALLSSPEQRGSILGHTISSLTDIRDSDRPEGDSLEKDRLVELCKSRQLDWENKPPRPPTRYFLGETSICTAGNLTAIAAAIKSGKSSVLTAMMASAMCENPEGLDFLGFSSSNPQGHALIHIDTEQSREDHDDLVRRAIRRAGLTEPPPWLYSFCLTGIPVKDLQAILWLMMKTTFMVHKGIHSVLIDGVADMVSDVNEPEDCNSFVAELHGHAILYKCPIIGIIHLNPGTEKTRGHLGSQLERKSETNLRMEREGDTEAIVMWADKTRKAPILKKSAPRFAWSDDAGMHVSVDHRPNESTAGGAPSVVSQIASMNSHEFMAACLPQGENLRTIMRRLEGWLGTQKMDVSSATCQRAIQALVANGKLSKGADLMYRRGPNS